MRVSRKKLRELAASASGLAIMLLRFATPRRHHVVVAGWSPDEPNASELVRALTHRYSGEVWWVSPPSANMREAVGVDRHPRLVLAPNRWRWSVICAYATAEMVFTTHGLYGMPATPRRKPVVNIWHGEQAKGGGAMFPFRRLPGRPSTHLLVASKRLASAKLSRAEVLPEGMIWAANPRVDQLRRPATDEKLSLLGIDADRPFVIWMPTFRQGKDALRERSWINTTDPALDTKLHEIFISLVGQRLTDAGYQIVVKPHPLDLLTRSTNGAVVILSEDLDTAGVPLYSLLGRSAGLITDYSSVWVDCLAITLPTAFFMPDRRAYEAGRGDLPAGGYEHLPGPILEDEVSVQLFINDVTSHGQLSESLRMASIEHLGLDVRVDAAERVLELLSARSPLMLSR